MKIFVTVLTHSNGFFLFNSLFACGVVTIAQYIVYNKIKNIFRGFGGSEEHIVFLRNNFVPDEHTKFGGFGDF